MTIPSPTRPPTGTFSIIFYPPLVLNYPADLWIDKSEYDNTERMVNYLQNKDLKTCAIFPIGPSGFYPDNMKEITLGDIHYQILLNQTTTNGNAISYYFAISAPKGSIESEAGIPHFDVQSSPKEATQCKEEAEIILATLHRADQPN